MKPAASALVLVVILVQLQLQLLLLLASGKEEYRRRSDVYIVYFGQHSGEKAHREIEDTHHSYLFSVKDSEEEARASLLYSYKHSINGFAALLTPHQASTLSELEEVVSVFRSHPRKHSMHTTRSWEFAGLDIEEADHYQWRSHDPDMMKGNHDLLLRARYGNGAIVGLLDNGVWPESKSFSDQQMGPIPNSWKGICQTGQDFDSSHCNKKLIGARYYLKGYEQFYGPLNTTIDYRSPRDKDGHGTHTASTVGGQRVTEASALGGFALGTASGGAPLVHLAIYKVCWAIPHKGKEEGNTCFEEDMLAAIDDAIADGVNVLSISIGTSKPTSYEHDGIAIGALHAIKNDIVVACSAGNDGPASGTTSNNAPWIITVGASSVDRAFTAPLILGNGMTVEGQTVTPYKMETKMYPLVYAADVSTNADKNATTDGQCLPGSLEPEQVKGKIVMCMRGQGTRVGKGKEVKRAGGLGFILGNSLANGAELTVDAHVLPATALDSENAIQILKYINSTKNPTAYITPATTILNHKPAPSMAAFSSRGPNPITPDILKPDITAPGLNILAAWSEVSSPTKLEDDNRRVKYNILSGTSMSCPHVAAAAALLRVIHPTWSSASIRSALITSAGLTNNKGMFLTDASGHKPADPFQFGSGHFGPTKAADPGLVYDASYTDYLLFLCSNGVKNIDPSFKCPELSPSSNNLNYPSIAISKVINGSVIINRTVTNMGGENSVYSAKVRSPAGFNVKVSPSTLAFDHIGEKKTFAVTVRPQSGRKVAHKTSGENQYSFGWLTWSDGVHIVRSPIAVSLPSSTA